MPAHDRVTFLSRDCWCAVLHDIAYSAPLFFNMLVCILSCRTMYAAPLFSFQRTQPQHCWFDPWASLTKVLTVGNCPDITELLAFPDVRSCGRSCGAPNSQYMEESSGVWSAINSRHGTLICHWSNCVSLSFAVKPQFIRVRGIPDIAGKINATLSPSEFTPTIMMISISIERGEAPTQLSFSISK